MTYTPGRPPSIQSLDELRSFVEEELQKIAIELPKQSLLQLEVQNVAVEKPREGMLVFADGTNWNPGSGVGTYEYRGAAWHKL